MSRVLLPVAIGLLVTALSAPAAHAQSGVLTGGTVGAQLYSLGGTVDIEVRPSAAGFVSELYLQRPGGDIFIATNRATGTTRTVGPYANGEELVFYIRVANTGDIFYTGPASRNLDGVAHAAVLDKGDGSLLVGFEDIFGGGDLDYDDNVFQFTGSVAPNRPPVADDGSVTTNEDTPVDLALTASDPDGAIASYAVTQPANGTLSGSGASWTYTPDADFNGSDSFEFTVIDDDGLADTAIVTIAVNAVNDLPIAHDSSVVTDEDTPVDITFSSSDVDGDPVTYEVIAGPSNGTLSGTGATRTYTPDADYNGADVIHFSATDGNGGTDTGGSVSIDVLAVQDTPVAVDDVAATDENAPVTWDVVANDTDGDGQPLTASLASPPFHGTATCSGSSCTYLPVSNFVGTDTFEYRASDPDGNSDVATVTVTVRRIGADGRMAGRSHRGSGASRVQQELNLFCKAADGGAMTVRGADSTFVLTAVDYALCTLAAGADPGSNAAFETHEGSGTGTLNGVGGATVEWRLVDNGEGNDPADTVDITVRNAAGTEVLRSSGPIRGGNVQAHRR